VLISVIGAGKTDPQTYQLAMELGEVLAQKGATVICGGLSGVMEAVCKGAHKHGGLTVGILPRDARQEANPYVDIPIPTGLGIARNAIVVKAGEAVIALDGEYGTLSEIAMALAEHIPVVSLSKWILPHEMHRNIIIASNPREAVEKAIAAINKSSTTV
jgi:uncharacterized protein (TIGR00725 family)